MTKIIAFKSNEDNIREKYLARLDYIEYLIKAKRVFRYEDFCYLFEPFTLNKETVDVALYDKTLRDFYNTYIDKLEGPHIQTCVQFFDFLSIEKKTDLFIKEMYNLINTYSKNVEYASQLQAIAQLLYETNSNFDTINNVIDNLKYSPYNKIIFINNLIHLIDQLNIAGEAESFYSNVNAGFFWRLEILIAQISHLSISTQEPKKKYEENKYKDPDYNLLITTSQSGNVSEKVPINLHYVKAIINDFLPQLEAQPIMTKLDKDVLSMLLNPFNRVEISLNDKARIHKVLGTLYLDNIDNDEITSMLINMPISFWSGEYGIILCEKIVSLLNDNRKKYFNEYLLNFNSNNSLLDNDIFENLHIQKYYSDIRKRHLIDCVMSSYMIDDNTIKGKNNKYSYYQCLFLIKPFDEKEIMHIFKYIEEDKITDVDNMMKLVIYAIEKNKIEDENIIIKAAGYLNNMDAYVQKGFYEYAEKYLLTNYSKYIALFEEDNDALLFVHNVKKNNKNFINVFEVKPIDSFLKRVSNEEELTKAIEMLSEYRKDAISLNPSIIKTAIKILKEDIDPSKPHFDNDREKQLLDMALIIIENTLLKFTQTNGLNNEENNEMAKLLLEATKLSLEINKYDFRENILSYCCDPKMYTSIYNQNINCAVNPDDIREFYTNIFDSVKTMYHLDVIKINLINNGSSLEREVINNIIEETPRLKFGFKLLSVVNMLSYIDRESHYADQLAEEIDWVLEKYKLSLVGLGDIYTEEYEWEIDAMMKRFDEADLLIDDLIKAIDYVDHIPYLSNYLTRGEDMHDENKAYFAKLVLEAEEQMDNYKPSVLTLIKK